MPGLGSQLQNIGTALAGFSAGLQGNLPQFQAAQNQKIQQEQQMQMLQQEQMRVMAAERQKTMFSDAAAALQLTKMGNLDGVVQLGLNRLQGLQQLSQQDPNIDPSDTQRVTQLAIAARNGDEEALELLTAELESAVQVGQAIGVLEAPKAATELGKLQQDLSAGLITQEQYDQASEADRETAQDQNGVLRFVDDGSPVFPEVATMTEGLNDKDRFDRAKTIRSEIDTANKEFNQLANSWDRIAASADDPSAAGDLALIFNYMKMLDPGSTVREGEFATAQSAAGVDDRIRGAYNRVVNGERLTPGQRSDFFNQAQNIFDAADSRAQLLVDQYVKIAERSGLTREDVVISRGAAPVIDHGRIGRFTVTEIVPEEDQ